MSASAPLNSYSSNIKYSVEPRWYVVYVKSRSEKKVRDRLAKQKLNTFLPLIKTVRQWSDRRKQVEIPLFNGYLFVHIVPDEFTIVKMTEGVVDFVKQEGKFATIRDEQILSLSTFYF
jgi:transcription antitermination factor NusG